jgi:solute carrier family 9B (sodium/hydrogen exchanger), member 1/2
MMVVSADFRKIALIVILLWAGFTLRRETLNRTARPALLLSFVPASLEIAAVALAAVYFFNFSWLQAAMLGAILGAVSPAVVIPMMIYFMERGRGAKKKGIPTFVLAGSTLDNVYAILIFTQFLALYQGVKVSIFQDLINIPIAVTLGICLGLAAGFLLVWFFSRHELVSPRAPSWFWRWPSSSPGSAMSTKTWSTSPPSWGSSSWAWSFWRRPKAWAKSSPRNCKNSGCLPNSCSLSWRGAQVNPKVAYGAGRGGSGNHRLRPDLPLPGYLPVCPGGRAQLAGKAFLRPVLYSQGHRPGGHRRHSPGSRGPRRRTDPGHGSALGPDHRPPGAIAISLWGERVLDEEELSGYRFVTLRDKLRLPGWASGFAINAPVRFGRLSKRKNSGSRKTKPAVALGRWSRPCPCVSGRSTATCPRAPGKPCATVILPEIIPLTAIGKSWKAEGFFIGPGSGKIRPGPRYFSDWPHPWHFAPDRQPLLTKFLGVRIKIQVFLGDRPTAGQQTLDLPI